MKNNSASESSFIFCKNCGAQLPHDELFCDKCGTPVYDFVSNCAEPFKICPQCTRIKTSGVRICNCGYEFTGNEKYLSEKKYRTYRNFYYSPSDNVPMSFHKFLIYFYIPLSLLINFVYLVKKLDAFSQPILLYNIFITIVLLSLLIIAETGLVSKKEYGRLAIIAANFFDISSVIFLFLVSPSIYSQLDSAAWITLIILTLFRIIKTWLITIYYRKRKYLFSNSSEESEKNKSAQHEGNFSFQTPNYSTQSDNGRQKDPVLPEIYKTGKDEAKASLEIIKHYAELSGMTVQEYIDYVNKQNKN